MHDEEATVSAWRRGQWEGVVGEVPLDAEAIVDGSQGCADVVGRQVGENARRVLRSCRRRWRASFEVPGTAPRGYFVRTERKEGPFGVWRTEKGHPACSWADTPPIPR